jgi:integrase
VLLPELAQLLREHRQQAFQRGHARTDSFVFSTSEGTAHYYRNVCVRGLDRAAKTANLNPDGVPKLSMHDLRHSFASHLIRQGLDPVRAARQLGHARPSITLDIYAHDFEAARQRDDISERLTAAFAGALPSRT